MRILTTNIIPSFNTTSPLTPQTVALGKNVSYTLPTIIDEYPLQVNLSIIPNLTFISVNKTANPFIIKFSPQLNSFSLKGVTNITLVLIDN
jgi:hypothetical protein